MPPISFKDLILKETPQYLVINKPAGLIVEKNPYESPTIEEMALTYLQASKPNAYLGIVHRLDRVTSGVLLLAKKKSALKNFNEQFRLRKVRKTYLALVENAPQKTKASLTHWLQKDLKNKKAIISSSPAKNASECKLRYRLLKTTAMGYLLEIQPHTGKFHQIRAQLSAIGCPIVGDQKYGGSGDFGLNAVALHASKLQFRDTISGELQIVEAIVDWGI
ncbi:MAG: RluA family pseudouridine synthase [Chitinophagales bacterium]